MNRNNMVEEALKEELELVFADLKQSLSAQILYDMCDAKLYPWGDLRRLKEKFFLVGKVYDLTLREPFLCYGERMIEGKRRSRHRRIDLGETVATLAETEAFRAFTGKIAAVDRTFAFDGSADDLERFRESVLDVCELNDLFCAAVTAYDARYRQPVQDRSNNYYLASRMLHLHRPELFFSFGREIDRGRSHFHNADGCRLGRATLAKMKREIAEVYITAAQVGGAVLDDLPRITPKSAYLLSAALEYAICCYLEAHGGVPAEVRSPIAAAAEIVARIQYVESREKIERIAAQLRTDMAEEEMRLYCRDEAEWEQVLAAYRARRKE